MESVVPGHQLRGCYPAKRNPASCPAGVLSESTSAWFRASDLPVCGLGLLLPALWVGLLILVVWALA